MQVAEEALEPFEGRLDIGGLLAFRIRLVGNLDIEIDARFALFGKGAAADDPVARINIVDGDRRERRGLAEDALRLLAQEP